MQETWVGFLGWEVPWKREWPPTPVLLPADSHEGRSLVGYSPWGRRKPDMTEQLTSLSLLFFLQILQKTGALVLYSFL